MNDGAHSLVSAFKAVVRRCPGRVAVILPATPGHDERRVTYQELDRWSDALGGQLRDAGLRPGDPAAIYMHRSLECVAAILAVLKAGGTYVPMDPDHPVKRIRFMADDCQIRVALIASEKADRHGGAVRDCGMTPVVVAASWPDGGDSKAGEAVDPAPAYIIYTSGSTGQPKGVVVPHAGILRLVSPRNTYCRFDESRVFLLLAPLTFDAATLELWGPLLNGGTCVVYPHPGIPEPRLLKPILRDYGITTLWLTSSLFNLITDADPDTLLPVQELLVGGEALSIAHVRKASQHLTATQLINGYGPTESTTFTCCYRLPKPIPSGWTRVPIGYPIHRTDVHILDEQRRPVKPGDEGLLHIGGDGLAAGYRNRPELTAERFVTVEIDGAPRRLYDSGDYAAWLEGGLVDFIGRKDEQVKVSGFRIELGEVNEAVKQIAGVRDAFTTVVGEREKKQLVSYVAAGPAALDAASARKALEPLLPFYMIPKIFVFLPDLPLTENGKVDRKALPDPGAGRQSRQNGQGSGAAVDAQHLQEVAAIWQRELAVAAIGLDENIFDLGGTSIIVLQIVAALRDELGMDVSAVDVFDNPTVRSLAASRTASPVRAGTAPASAPVHPADEPIAIIGMSGRFAGADDLDQFWANLRDGVEALEISSDEQLLAAGLSRDELAASDYVRAHFSAAHLDAFDAAFFGYTPREVELMDPQHRLFLELCWLALDSAGYADASRHQGRVGVFGGVARDSYSHVVVSRHPDFAAEMGEFHVNIGNDKNFPCTRVAYKLNFTGPAITVQTACSTSGVALHLACQSLRAGECDMALVGGVRVLVPIGGGYRHVEDGALSSDGHLRAFDRQASGMVRGSGGAFVLVKRLSDALRDGDPIRALVRSTAIVNDGNRKAGYTAPSVKGQAETIVAALRAARLDARDIDYVEAHGTGTRLGDPIEFRALTRAYEEFTADRQFCALGSVKTNVGHLDAGSAVAGIIKTTLAMEHGEIPPSLNYTAPNPEIDPERSPFFVCRERQDWPVRGHKPRLAGVSSFGLGGTNFHGILSSLPERSCAAAADTGTWYPVAVSAHTQTALFANLGAAKSYCREHRELPLGDIAYSISCFRPRQPHRGGFLVCRRRDGGVEFGPLLEAPGDAASVLDDPAALRFNAETGAARRWLDSWLASDAWDGRETFMAHGARRVALPAYQFARQRYWLDLPQQAPHLLIGGASAAIDVAAGGVPGTPSFQTLPAEPPPFGGVLAGASARDNTTRLAELVAAPQRRAGNSTVFLLPGGGAQYVNMARGLYERLPRFREVVDEGLSLFWARTGTRLESIWFAPSYRRAEAERLMLRPSLQLPALFMLEVALARQFEAWGLTPDALIGHSMGENAAACIAGVMSYADGLGLVSLRGELFEAVVPGRMVSVAMPAERYREFARDGLSLATINAPQLCTVSGTTAAIEGLCAALDAAGIDYQPIPISIAAHSQLLDPILPRFRAYLESIELRQPAAKLQSNLTGTWLTGEQATSPDYWVRHLRETVRFADNVGQALTLEHPLFVELGPGRILSSIVGANDAGRRARTCNAIRHGGDEVSDVRHLLGVLGQLWLCGSSLDLSRVRRDMPFEIGYVDLETYRKPETRPAAAAPVPAPPPAVFPVAAAAILPAVAAATAPQPTRGGPVPDRRSLVTERVLTILRELSGLPDAELKTDASFISLGFDSLRLTQVNTRIKKDLKLKLSLKTLMKDAASPLALMAHIDRELPADALKDELSAAAAAAAPPPAAAVAPAVALPAVAPGIALPAVALPAGGGGLLDLIALQLQAQAAMLAMLQGQAVPMPVAAAAAPAPAPAAVPPAPTAVAKGASPAPAEAAAHGPFRPLVKGTRGTLSAQQKSALEDFIRRYQAKTPTSKALAAETRNHYADPRTVMGFKTLWKEITYTLAGARSKGSRVWDVDGNEYVDCMSGFGSILLGHSPDFLLDALRRQMDTTLDYGPQSLVAGPAARLLCELTGFDRASFCNTGSEAVLAGMRIARTVSGNDLIATFSGDYHGIFDEVLVRATGHGDDVTNVPIAPGIPQNSSANVLLLEYGSDRALEIIRERAGELAGVLVEPIQSRHCETQPFEFVRKLRALTQELDIPLIFDELVTGFRVAQRGAQDWYGVQPDIACYGKAIANGLAIGAVAGRHKFMDALDGGRWQFGDDSGPEAGVTYFAGTFVRHPLSLAAAAAVLQYYKDAGPGLQQDLNRRTALFCETVNRAYRQMGVPVRLLYFGSAFFVKYEGDPDFEVLYTHCLRFYGAHHIWGNRPGFLTTAHTDEDLAFLERAFVAAAREMQNGGFFPGEAAAGATVRMTPAQQEIWLAMQLGPQASAAYNEQVVFDLPGPLDPAALELAFDRAVNRHESLRSAVAADGESLQIRACVKPEFHYHDLGGGPAGEETWRRLAQENIDRPFDLYNANSARLLLLRLADDRHVVCLAVSHLVCDGWSLEKVMEDVAAYYTAIQTSKMAQRPRSIPLAEHAAALAARAADGDHANARTYWLGQYQDKLPEALRLPLDRPWPATRTFAGERQVYRFDNALMAPLRALATASGCTTFALVLAAFQVHLRRLSQQREIVLGVPAASQPVLGLNNLVTHGVSFLPVRQVVDPQLTFKAFMLQVRDQFMDAKENQDFSYGELLSELALPRESGKLPLVSVSFNLDLAYNAMVFNGVKGRFVATPRGFVKFDLVVNLTDQGDEVLVEIDRYTEIFDGRTIDELVSEFAALLRRITASPDDPVGRLDGGAAAQPREFYAALNDTARSYPAEPVHLLFEAQVEASPDATAVVVGAEELSYRQLNARANRLANLLIGRGIGPGQRVGICVERGTSLLTAILGVVKTGAAYVPMDASYPPARLRYMVDDCAMPAVIAEAALADRLAGAPGLVVVDRESDDLARGGDANPPCRSGLDDVFYVIYTSGSTGKPKGAGVYQRGVLNLLHWYIDAHEFNSATRALVISAFGFDLTQKNLLAPLLAGGSVHFADAPRYDPVAVVDAASRGRLTHVNCAPSMFYPLVDGTLPYAGLGSLRWVILAGEAVRIERLRPWFQSGACRATFVNYYGPTEATDAVTSYVVTDPAAYTGASVPIGRPIPNVQVYVLDDRGELAPPGSAGELYIGGDGVGSGYLNDAERTAQVFVKNPFGPGRLYRSGDLVRCRKDGEIEFLSRRDAQVKVRGFRIELEEIEAQLERQPGVRRAAVAAVDGPSGEKVLAGYIVAADGAAVDGAALRRALRQELPDYMVPMSIVSIPAIPLNANGKADRAALPRPEFDGRPAAADAAPTTPTERAVAAIWQEVLGLAAIGSDENFFDLGGHSLLGTRVFAKIRSQLGATLGLHLLFEAPTIRQLAAMVDGELNGDRTRLAAVTIPRRSDPVAPPATSQQARLWYVEQIEPAFVAHNNPAAWKLTGRLDLAALQRAVNTILERHSALRTNFELINGVLVQLIRPHTPVELTPVTLADMGLASLDDLSAFISRSTGLAQDVARDPLFKAGLVKMADDQHVIYFVIHHLIFDGWSYDLLLKELARHYNAFCAGQPSPLLPPPIQYSDYALWQRDWLDGEYVQKQLDYWVDKLAGELPVLQLPTDRPRPPLQSHEAGYRTLFLDEELVIRLEQLAKRNGSTLFMVLIGLYALVLYRYSRQKDLVVGVPISGRTTDEVGELLGFFVNTLAFRFAVDPEQPFDRWLESVRNVTLEAFDHQEVAFEMVVQKLNPERALSHSPIYQTQFSYQDIRNRTDSMSGLVREQVIIPRAGVQTDLDVWVRRERHGVAAGMEFPVALFDSDTVAAFMSSFEHAARAVAGNHALTIAELAAATPAERDQIGRWNAGRLAGDRAGTFLERFAKSAAGAPGAVAVQGGDASVTYAELDAQANRLANHLVSRGVKPGDLVAVCLEREASLVSTLLGVWKAGAGYVPLDPEYPAARLRQMLDASGAAVVVTQSSLAGTLDGYQGDRMLVDAERGIAAQRASAPQVVPDPDAVAYVIFTSGSTGVPKGVQVTHRSVANFLASMAAEPGLTAGQRLLAVTTICFDISVLELFLPLSVGATVVVASAADGRDAHRLKALLARHTVDVMQATPSTWRLLLSGGWRGGPEFTVLCGGEALPPDLAPQLTSAAGRVWNLYGPTETTVWSTCHPLAVGSPVLIGRPIANTQCHVLDPGLREMPIGVAGELFIGGTGVARGYIGDAATTSARFLPDSRSLSPGARMYRTGDRVRWRRDGRLEYLTRLDNQIKLRGFRIEPGDIEAALSGHEQVAQCAVAVRAFGPGDDRLVAYLCCRDRRMPTNTELRRFLRQALPEYMIPQLFVELEAMPLTANGKVDRAALPSPVAPVSRTREAPRTAAERLIADLWSEMLGVGDVGVRDNFFDLGGHSLLSVEFVQRVWQQTGHQFEVRQLLMETLEQLAAKMRLEASSGSLLTGVS